MSDVSTYARAVEANLRHMGTPMDEWRACAYDLAIDGDGRVCVSSVLPPGYASAPSMFHNGGSGDMCCELCGHKIRHAYYCQDDAKRWTLLVGSECVKAFAGVDGAELADEAERALALDLLTWIVAALPAVRFAAAHAYDPGCTAHFLRVALFKLHLKCNNASVDPLAWMRRNKAAIAKAMRKWSRAAGAWADMTSRRPDLPPLPRPPEAWLPENVVDNASR